MKPFVSAAFPSDVALRGQCQAGDEFSVATTPLTAGGMTPIKWCEGVDVTGQWSCLWLPPQCNVGIDACGRGRGEEILYSVSFTHLYSCLRLRMLGQMSCDFVFPSLILFKYKVTPSSVAKPFSYTWYNISDVQTVY